MRSQEPRRGWGPGAASAAPPHVPAPPHEGVTLDPRRLVRAFRRFWWVVVSSVVVLVGAVWYLKSDEPERFTAQATVQVLDQRRALTGRLTDDDRSPSSSITSLMEVLRSGAVATEVVRAAPELTRVRVDGFERRLLDTVVVTDSAAPQRIVLLFDEQGFRPDSGREPRVRYGAWFERRGVGLRIASRPSASTGTIRVLDERTAATRVRSAISGSPRKQSNIVDVDYRDASPMAAVALANHAVLAFQAVNARNAQQQSRRRREFIEEQLVRNDAQLAEAERLLSEYRTSQASNLRAPNDVNVLESRSQELSGERRLAREMLGRLRSGDSASRAAGLRMLASSPELSANVVTRRLLDQLAGYQAQRLERTSGSWGGSAASPEVQRLDSLIATTQRQIDAALETHIALLDARLESLAELQSTRTSALRQLPAREAMGIRLAQNADALREQASLLRSEMQRSRIAEAAEIGVIDIVDLATVSRPIQSTGMRMLVLAGVLGFLLGSGLAVLLEFRDSTVQRRDDLEFATGVPVLGTIPRIVPAASGARAAMMSRFVRNDAGSLGNRRHVALATAATWRSAAAEAHRQLRATVFHWYTPRTDGPQRIMFTSACAGEGKTSIAVNFATTLAQQGARVLLIDCDLHQPRLHRIFDVPLTPGVGQVLVGSETSRAVVRPTQLPGLSLVAAGKMTNSPADALASDRMRAMVEELSADFDVIVFDSSPVLAVADSLVLSAYADAVLLVVRMGRTTTMDVSEAMRHLGSVYAPVVGTVLNDPEGKAEEYGNYNYGYGTYGYVTQA